jgi:hypothetical protein
MVVIVPLSGKKTRGKSPKDFGDLPKLFGMFLSILL